MTEHAARPVTETRIAAFMSGDIKEGVAAFFEKRPPCLQGSVTDMTMGDFPC